MAKPIAAAEDYGRLGQEGVLSLNDVVRSFSGNDTSAVNTGKF